MAVTIDVNYEGGLSCVAVHGPSGDRLPTDAPTDNRGRGRHFSPTDLVGAALGTCTLTVMGIAAEDRGIDMTGARARVVKDMGATPRRHIARLAVTIALPARLTPDERALLERAAHGCPVHASLGSLTAVDLVFDYV